MLALIGSYLFRLSVAGFVDDDAFLTFRCAEQLAQGTGLVRNA